MSVGASASLTTLRKLATSLPEVWELRPEVHGDARGFVFESYHRERFVAAGVADDFVQDNHSRSAKGTLRGLHYQLHRPQSKLCRVVEGEALDVAVDIRLGSPNFGKWTSVVLSSAAHNEIYIPKGFAHGFLALTDSVQFLYKCSDYYDPTDEYGIVWNDPALAIRWGVTNPLISAKDTKFGALAEMPRELLPKYSVK